MQLPQTGIILFFLKCTFSLFAATLPPHVIPLETWDARGLALPQASGETTANKQVVLVDGFFNEPLSITGHYFADTISVLNELHIPFEHFGFSSRSSFVQNANTLYERIQEIKRHSQVISKQATMPPIILVGHSMGGNEILYMLLQHPELITDNTINRVVLIQSALGGSTVVNGLPTSYIGCITCWLFADGIASLHTDFAKNAFRDIYGTFIHRMSQTSDHCARVNTAPAQCPEFNTFSNKIFYIRSSFHPVDSRGERSPSPSLAFLSRFFPGGRLPEGENDGLLNINDQILGLQPFLGIDLGVLAADHNELTISGPLSHFSSAQRENFTRAILHYIYASPSALHAALGDHPAPRNLWP